MTTTQKIQRRGICQHCGREQAVMASDRMSKHGYTVADGWFKGVCRGDLHQPMNFAIDETTRIVAQVRKDCAGLVARAADIESGAIPHPMVEVDDYSQPRVNGRLPKLLVEFADLPSYRQPDVMRMTLWNIRARAESGRDWAARMETLAAETLNTPLVSVRRDDGPAPILNGEKKTIGRYGVCEVTRVWAGKVSYRDEKGFLRSISTRAWRALPATA